MRPGPLGCGQQLAEAEDDAALVLVQDLDREQQPEDDGADHEDDRSHHAPFRTRNRSPSIDTTWSGSPRATALLGHGLPPLALHDHPALGVEVRSRPVARSPTSPSAPVTGRRRWAWITSRTSSGRPRRHDEHRREQLPEVHAQLGKGRVDEHHRAEDHGDEAAHGQEAVRGDLDLGREEADRQQDQQHAGPVDRDDLAREQEQDQAERAQDAREEHAGVADLGAEAGEGAEQQQEQHLRPGDRREDGLPPVHVHGDRLLAGQVQASPCDPSKRLTSRPSSWPAGRARPSRRGR